MRNIPGSATAIGCLIGVAVLGQTTDSPKKSYEFDVSGSVQWLDTKIDLLPGARVQITATGSLQYDQAPQAATPEGLPRGWKDLLRVMPLNDSGRGALIGKIGADGVAGAFLIGAKHEVRTAQGGRLSLGINQMSSETAAGSFHATVQILDPGSSDRALVFAPESAKTLTLSGLNAELFSKIPRRVADQAGDPGDMVNFLILGTADQMKKTFQTAGWVVVDRTRKDAVVHGLVSSLSKQSYVEMPMSELYLFGRPQDFGMAHAEPYAVVATRHHLRVWKAPFDLDGQTLWVGAATHDIGFDKDERNNGITHKIDPDIDLERKYLAQSLADTGLVTQLGYFTPPNALSEARTATGGTFHSDGKVLVMVVGDSPADK